MSNPSANLMPKLAVTRSPKLPKLRFNGSYRSATPQVSIATVIDTHIIDRTIIPHYNVKRKAFGVNMANNISDRIQLGKTDLWVSPVGFGVLPMGPGQLALPVDEGAELICYALEKGINFIDTAQYYKTYPYIRRALEMLGVGDAEIIGDNSSSGADSVAEDGGIGESDASSVPLCGQRVGDAGAAPTGASPAEFGCGPADSDFANANRRANSGRVENALNAHIACAHIAAGAAPEAAHGGAAAPEVVGAGFVCPASDFEANETAGARSAPAPRRPVISSKTLATDYEGAYSAIQEECQLLGVPFIDIFLLHEIRTGQFAMRQGAWRALMDAKAEGLVRAIGVSTHHVDVVEELTLVPECDVIFPLLNYAGMGVRRGSEAASCADMASAIAEARGAGKGIYIMKALGGGNLAAHYHKALDYVFSQDDIDSVMLGFGCHRDIDDIISYLDGTMPPDYAPDVSAKRVRINQEDCEGCGICIATCHSAAIAYNRSGLAEIDQTKCITCGYCAQACPVRAIIMY